jgi:heptosyltransferase-3
MPGRILIIRGGAIGDFILTLPAIRLVRENFPDCHLEILGYRHIAALAEGRFYADATRSIEYGPLAGFFNPKADQDPELVAYFSGFQQVVSYLYDPDALFETSLRKAGVKNLIIGSPKLTDGSHAARQLARPLEKLALWLDDPAATFFPSSSDQAAAARHLGADAPARIALHPGSGGERKNWPVIQWRELLQTLLRTYPGVHFLIVGGESDTARLGSLREMAGCRIRFLESLPLPELGAVFSQCVLFLGHDSGISHLAAASGCRSLLLFGPTDPGIWAPANSHVTVLRAPEGDLSRLEVSAVLAKVTDLYDAGT